MITGKTINELSSTTPSINDTTISSESGTPTISKRTTWQAIRDLFKSNFDTVYEVLSNKSTSVTTDQASNTKYPSVKSVYDWAVGAFAKYSGDADFYQYSISRTVDGSGNLTVALKNYEGNDPTPTKPVKIMIGGVVRTITSDRSVTINSGTNWFNSGSSELATKEIDYFQYIAYNATNNECLLFVSRIPYATVGSDFSSTSTNEKYVATPYGFNPIDQVVNIGRFNAILSGGPGYTWSIPSTSVIVNRPIYETRELSFTNSLFSDGTLSGVTHNSTYIISMNKLIVKNRISWSNLTGTATYISTTKPIQDNFGAWIFKGIADTYSSSGHKLCMAYNDGGLYVYFNRQDGANFTTGSGSVVYNENSTI